MDPRERLLDYYTADVALLAVGTLASFGLWVYGCCLKRSTHDLGRFMTFTRAGLGLATIALLFEMVCYAIILAAYHGSDADIEVTALEQLLNFVSILLHLVYAAIFLGIVALTQRILRARKGIAPAWPLRAAYVWVGILTALAIARYGIAVYRTDAYDRMFWQMEYDDLDWEAIEAGLTLQSAIAIMWFATGLVSFAASAFVVARHRISTVVSRCPSILRTGVPYHALDVFHFDMVKSSPLPHYCLLPLRSSQPRRTSSPWRSSQRHICMSL
jgi:hypothetical protein